MEEPSAKNPKLEEDDGVTQKSLVQTITTLSTSLNSLVNEGNRNLAAVGAEEFAATEIRRLGKGLSLYANYLAGHGASTYKEAEKIASPFCRYEGVRDALEELLEAEDRYNSLLSQVDKQLSPEDGNKLLTSSQFPLDLSLGLLPSSAEENVTGCQLPTISIGRFLKKWQGPTLFVLLRHLS